MAGQGTIGLEILEDCPEVETVVVPIGGGGLISGIAVAIKEQQPDVRVIGVQANGASSAAASLARGERVSIDEVDTIADGIATRSIGEQTFPLHRGVRRRGRHRFRSRDRRRAGLLARAFEDPRRGGAGAVPLAAVLFEKFDYAEDEVIVPALCGGNIDLNTLANVIVRGLVETGRYLKIKTVLKDRPGALDDLLDIFTEQRVNIYAIHHDHTSRNVEMATPKSNSNSRCAVPTTSTSSCPRFGTRGTRSTCSPDRHHGWIALFLQGRLNAFPCRVSSSQRPERGRGLRPLLSHLGARL